MDIKSDIERANRHRDDIERRIRAFEEALALLRVARSEVDVAREAAPRITGSSAWDWTGRRRDDMDENKKSLDRICADYGTTIYWTEKRIELEIQTLNIEKNSVAGLLASLLAEEDEAQDSEK